MRIIKLLFIFFTFYSCTNKSEDKNVSNSVLFAEINYTYLDERWSLDPKTATHFRFEEYNDQLIPFTPKYMESVVKWAKDKLLELQNVNYFSLTNSEKIDYELIKNDLDGSIFWIEQIKFYTWNPEIYNLYVLFMITLNGEDSLNKKLYNVNERLKIVPEFLSVAQTNLVKPGKESTIETINRLETKIDLLDKLIQDSIKVSTLSNSKKRDLNENLMLAKSAQVDFLNFLKEKLNNKNSEFRSFQMGKENYPTYYKTFISKWIDEKQIHDIALTYKDKTKAEMEAITKKLWPKYFPEKQIPEMQSAIIELITEICIKNPIDSETIEEIHALLRKNIDFVNNNNLISHKKNDLPKLNLQEISSNPEQANFSILEDLSPLELAKYPIYNIQTIKGYPYNKESMHYLNFNKFTIELLSLNLIPGYYTKYLHAPKDISDVKSVFRKGSNKNGWAAYAQQMMITNGYNNNELKDELLLVHYKYQLKMICNSIITYQVHMNNWNQKEVFDLLTTESYMSTKEANQEWNSLTGLGAEHIGSFNGYIEIIRLRDEIKLLEGEFFSLQSFHEEFLSYGYAPIEIIRQLMLEKYENLSYYQTSSTTY